MRPLLEPGDRLLLAPTRRQRLRAGDLVVMRDPRRPQRRIVKRVDRLEGGRAWLRGDNPAGSTDSRSFGWVALPRLVGRPVRRYGPAGRTGALAIRTGSRPPSTAVTTTPPAGAAGSADAPGHSAASRATRPER